MSKQRRTFSTEFKHDAANLVLDQGYSVTEAVEMVCEVFDVPASNYYEHKQLSKQINVERLEQRSKIKELFKDSRYSAGSRTLLGMMRELGYQIGRFKVMRLMKIWSPFGHGA